MPPEPPVHIDTDAVRLLPGLWAVAVRLEADPGLPRTPLSDPSDVLDPAWTLDNLKDHPAAAGYRAISWSVGIDPTKNRPAGEALARRILNRRPWPSIHPLVDAYNLASAATLVPLGAYDLDRITLPLTLRPARPDDVFHGIGRDAGPVDTGRIVYVSADGTVCGVLLWRDAMESRIRDETTQALVLAVGADPLPTALGHTALHRTVDNAERVGYRPVGEATAAT